MHDERTLSGLARIGDAVAQPLPSIGRTVHYVDMADGSHRAAKVTEVYGGGGIAEVLDTVGLFVMLPEGTLHKRHVPFDDRLVPVRGSWHWPERV